MTKDQAVLLAGEEKRVRERIRSDIKWMRAYLDNIEASVRNGESAGGSSSTITESLFQAVGEWDGIQRVKKILVKS